MTAPAVTAQYHGLCADCEGTIVPGQRIRRDDTDEAWEHVECGARAEKVVCACEKCFTVHNGECW